MPADSISRMDSNGSNDNEKNIPPQNILGTSPGTSSLRSRTDSECSDKLARFVLPSMDGSPPKVMTLDEVTNVVKNIQNMELAHEIALNPEFKLQPYEPPENSLEKRIKDCMHKAFWDLLREQLNSDPPSYDYAIQLLSEIKECFPQILTQNNKLILDQINDILDESVIRQQAEKGVLDFQSYANFIIKIMGKSCAPARDDDIKKLTQIEDVVDMFKGILDTMALMKLDMANFLLDFSRNAIMANSVEYEKQKFNEYLEYYKFGFPATENWLQRNLTQTSNGTLITADQAMSNAYMELMDWKEDVDFPEILSTDKERILKLGQRAKRLCVGASLIAICSAVPVISQRSENRIELAKQIEILLHSITNEKEISVAIDNIWEQIKTVINKYLKKESQSTMDTDALDMLQTQIKQIANRDAPVRQLMWKRLQTYFRLALRSKGGLPPPPPGYVDFKDELEFYTTALKRVIAYNHSVFGEYFLQILTQRQTEPNNETVCASEGASSEAEMLPSQQ
uniref:T-complex protein 11 n=1 Tax=Musca domestica TaxID=7370 RepID=T1PC90_MUSDO